MVREYIAHWLYQRRRNREIGEELGFHLQMCIEENLAKGMSPSEALEEARMRFGDFEEIHSTCCQLASRTEPDNDDPVMTYSPLSLPMSVWLLVGLLVPAGLLWFFTPHLMKTLPYPSPKSLYVTRHAVPLVTKDETEFSFFHWQQRNTVFKEFAGFAPLSLELRHPSGGSSSQPGLAVSSSFFSVLGVRPLLGSTFSGASWEDAVTPSVVLSYAFWNELGGDPAIVGKNLVFNRQPLKVAAVMPDRFWFLSPEVRFWVAMEAGDYWPARLRVVGRLQAGVAPQTISRELREMSGGDWIVRPGGWITPLTELTDRNIWAALAMMLIPLAVTLALGFVQIMSLYRLVAPARLKGGIVARYYAFLLAKSALALLPAAALWVVLTESPPALGPRWLVEGLRPAATLVMLLGCAAMVWWSLVDQRLRCPVCFRRLRMPVTLGTLGSILFDLPATEYICTHGHGTLHVPEPQTNEMETTRWRPHGDVWEELLAGAKK
jgi:hypothetical protein